jgi:hypothetical protein
MEAAGQDIPTYQRPQLSRKRQIFGHMLSSIAGTHRVGQEILTGPERRAREDYNLQMQRRQTRMGEYGTVANLEAKRRADRNTALWRATDLNYKGTRNAREENLLPYRMKHLESQIGRNAAAAGASKALEQNRRRPSGGRAPFRPFNPGQGIMDTTTGKVAREPNPAAARLARPTTSRSGVTPQQLAQVERNKTSKLLAHKKERDKRQMQIDADNAGMAPTLPDGSPNPMYTRDNDLGELEKWDVQQKNLIQRGYEQELQRLHQNVDPYRYDENAEGDGFNEPDEGEAGADMAADPDDDESEPTMMGHGDEAPDDEGIDPEQVPIGTVYRKPATGDRIQWDGQRWVPAR